VRVRIVGAGVSGLTCAARLLESGYDVEIWAAARSPNIVSAVAAALWYPLRRDFDSSHSLRRLAFSYVRFTALAAEPATGVMLRDGVELFRDGEPEPGWWSGEPSYARGVFGEGIAAFEWRALPVVEMPVYLDWLEAEVRTRGVRVETRAAGTLDDALTGADVVVNCAGLGARALAGDETLQPVRGQVVRVANPGIDRFILDEQNPAGPAYVIPRAHDVVCGGTREAGDESTDVREEASRAILARCVELEPRLRGAPVVSQAAGLRPARARVRLEAEPRGSKLVVHDYGHSGSGVTLSWGCAEDVAELVEAWVAARVRG
jgi:D-amino-acid oxidase